MIGEYVRPMGLGAMVARAYPSPEWAVFYEVADSTGFAARRRADAIALGIWPSRGCTILGFEFKEDRRDWLREKQNPAKAEAIASQCDGFYLVTGNEKIATLEEVPETWGLLIANADRSKLIRRKDAVMFTGDKTHMRRSFAAAMLRNVGESMVSKADVERLATERAEAMTKSLREGRDLEYAQREIAQLQKLIADFKEASGIDLSHNYHGPTRIGKAVAAVMDVDRHRRELELVATRLRLAQESIADGLANWPTTTS